MTDKADLKPVLRLQQRNTSMGAYFTAESGGRRFVMLKHKGDDWILLERIPLPEDDAGACSRPLRDASPVSGNG
jgi:hypothetical protein